MDILAEIEQRLQKYPAAHYVREGNSLWVLPESTTGFVVAMTASDGNYTVSFNGWHEEITDSALAIDCFAFGLSDACRLQEWRRGTDAFKWTMQYQQGGEWVDDSTTGLMISAFWKPLVVVYLQNHLLPASNAAPESH